jgi:hypothetical protein
MPLKILTLVQRNFLISYIRLKLDRIHRRGGWHPDKAAKLEKVLAAYNRGPVFLYDSVQDFPDSLIMDIAFIFDERRLSSTPTATKVQSEWSLDALLSFGPID